MHANIAESIWALSGPIGRQCWQAAEPDYPGHDTDGGFVEYRAMKIGGRVFLSFLNHFRDEPDATPKVLTTSCMDHDAVVERIRRHCHEGTELRWSGKKAAKVKRALLLDLIASHYEPLDGSALTHRAIVGMMASSQPASLGYLKVDGENVHLRAVTGMRTGVTTGIHIYDHALERLMRELGFSVTRVNAVGDAGCTFDAISRLKGEEIERRRSSRRNQIQIQIRDHEEQLRRLKDELASV